MNDKKPLSTNPRIIKGVPKAISPTIPNTKYSIVPAFFFFFSNSNSIQPLIDPCIWINCDFI